MAKLAVSEVTTYRWAFDEDASQYARLGFDGIGVWRRKLADFGEEKAGEILADLRLAVSSVTWAGGFTGADGRSLKESVSDAIDAVELTRRLGGQTVIVYTGPRGGHTRNHARRLLTSALKDVAAVAEEFNIRLALEPMHPACAGEWTFLTNLEETLDLIAAADSPALGVALDVYHLAHEPGFLDALPSILPRLWLVQVGDARSEPVEDQDRCRLGEGVLPIPELLGRLCQAGYDGFVELELLGPEIEASDYVSLLSAAKERLDDWLKPPA